LRFYVINCHNQRYFRVLKKLNKNCLEIFPLSIASPPILSLSYVLMEAWRPPFYVLLRQKGPLNLHKFQNAALNDAAMTQELREDTVCSFEV